MLYLLDTNAVIALMKNHARIVASVRKTGRSELVICAPVEAELWFGASKSSRIEENRQHLKTLLDWLPSLPFASDAARLSGEVRADLARKGTPIGPYDVQIAAIALANDCVLVTHNVGEFSRIVGLKVVGVRKCSQRRHAGNWPLLAVGTAAVNKAAAWTSAWSNTTAWLNWPERSRAECSSA